MEIKYPFDNRLQRSYLIPKVDKVYKSNNKEKEKEQEEHKTNKPKKNEKDEGFQVFL